MTRLAAAWGLALYGALLMFGAYPVEFAPSFLRPVIGFVFHGLRGLGLCPGQGVFGGEIKETMNKSTCVKVFGLDGTGVRPLYTSFPGCVPPRFRVVEDAFDATLRQHARKDSSEARFQEFWPRVAQMFCESPYFGNGAVDRVKAEVHLSWRHRKTGLVSREQRELVRYDCRKGVLVGGVSSTAASGSSKLF